MQCVCIYILLSKQSMMDVNGTNTSNLKYVRGSVFESLVVSRDLHLDSRSICFCRQRFSIINHGNEKLGGWLSRIYVKIYQILLRERVLFWRDGSWSTLPGCKKLTVGLAPQVVKFSLYFIIVKAHDFNEMTFCL